MPVELTSLNYNITIYLSEISSKFVDIGTGFVELWHMCTKTESDRKIAVFQPMIN
jgi:hypothetical protein